ncbi:MAG TPA: peptidoglycan-binding domain-containing protein [Archangium sp.]|uniref:peptidoglycan-binding domain-containing protein n=1 Tax=Archangium sp. TaxID=1872627 RepID=UPI002E317F3E|nr:peptidoglycan-binding domain-containing protein [Archangium sp.]HEX5749147.1 peptidoglycan-binding domain-containing protein [Archangium sp.]
MTVRRSDSSTPRTETPKVSTPTKSSPEKETQKTQAPPRNTAVDTFEAPPRPAPVQLAATRASALIDPRIATEARLQVQTPQRSQGPNGSMDVRTVAYQNDQQSGGNHNVYVRILDASGKEIPPEDLTRYFDVQFTHGPGQPVTSASPKLNDAYGVKQDAWTTSENTGGPTQGYFDIPMWGGNAMQVWVTPRDVPGNPYAGFGSQQVGPFTMPANHHVNFLVSFQAVPAGAQQQPPPVQPPPMQPPPVQPGPSEPRRGAEGPEVLAMQQELVRTGYLTQAQMATGPGTFGPATEAALSSFQRDQGLPVTGAYDAATRQALAAAPTQGQPTRADLGELVEGVYRSELGRASDPAGKQTWMDFAGRQRAQGKTDAEIRDTLVAMFRQSDEYRDRGPGQVRNPTPVTPPVGPAPVGAPGSVYAPYEVVPGIQVNGRLGAHWPVAYDPGNTAQVDAAIAKMKELGVGYTTMNLAPSELDDPKRKEQIQQVFDKLQAAGITPTVRIYEPSPPDQWNAETMTRMSDTAVALGNMGVRLIQLGNEPNIETGLEGRQGQVSKEQYLQDSVARQVDALAAIQDALAREGLSGQVKVGIPPMAAGASDEAPFAFAPDTYFKALVQGIAEHERTSSPPRRLVDWIATHTYVWEDGVNTGTSPGSGGARGQMGWGPETGPWYEKWAREALGYAPKSLSTEGGASPDSFRVDNTAQVARELDTTLEQLRDNPRLTGCLWMEWESVTGSNNWDRSIFVPRDGHADGAWREALPAYRDAWREANGG